MYRTFGKLKIMAKRLRKRRKVKKLVIVEPSDFGVKDYVYLMDKMNDWRVLYIRDLMRAETKLFFESLK